MGDAVLRHPPVTAEVEDRGQAPARLEGAEQARRDVEARERLEVELLDGDAEIGALQDAGDRGLEVAARRLRLEAQHLLELAAQLAAQALPRLGALPDQFEQARRRMPAACRERGGVEHPVAVNDTEARYGIGCRRERGVFHEIRSEKWNVRALTLALWRVYSGHFGTPCAPGSSRRV